MYPSDLTDDQWQIIQPFFPVPGDDQPKNGRPREWTYRHILNTIIW